MHGLADRSGLPGSRKGNALIYNRYEITVPLSCSELLADALAEGGFEGVEVNDGLPLTEAEQKAMFTDIPASLPESDGFSRLEVYVPEGERTDEEIRALIGNAFEEVRPFLPELPAIPQIVSSSTKDEDWANNWKAFFHGFRIGDLKITPSWEREAEEPAAGKASAGMASGEQAAEGESREEPQNDLPGHELFIDPGAAFGTGAHETTRLCIEALQKALQGVKKPESSGAASSNDPPVSSGETATNAAPASSGAVPSNAEPAPSSEAAGKTAAAAAGAAPVLLDIGTGSGILSIVAMLYGARGAVGVDLDPLALQSARENAEKNGIGEDRFLLIRGNLIEEEGLGERLLSLGEGLSDRESFRGFPLICGNLLAEVLIAMAPFIPRLLCHGGLFITSGILKEKVKAVELAFSEAGLVPWHTRILGDWALVTAKKPYPER